jgi:hypothetical protein
LVRAGKRAIPAGIAALAMGVALKVWGTYGVGPANAGLEAEPPGISVFGTIHPRIFDLPASLRSQIPDRSPVHLASLEADLGSGSSIEQEKPREVTGSIVPLASFDERFFFDEHLVSFDERFSGEAVSRNAVPTQVADAEERAYDVALLSQYLEEPVTAPPAISRSVSAPVIPLPPVNAAKKRTRSLEAPKEASLTDLSPPADSDNRTAIYDISAHMVYLPNGERLEAHSGLGAHLDDPRYINVKGRGPTPPNVYKLTLREQLFHGVRAIRLNPVDETKMFGRDGMLAHPYMLGPNGQSNGCVSFSNYPAFLNAYLRGEVNRLVVVERLASAPSPKTASGWFSETIKSLFGRS